MSYGFVHGDGFLISSMRPAMFFRNKLCIFFSSISRNFMTPRMGAGAGAAIFQNNLELASLGSKVCCLPFLLNEFFYDLSRLMQYDKKASTAAARSNFPIPLGLPNCTNAFVTTHFHYSTCGNKMKSWEQVRTLKRNTLRWFSNIALCLKIL